MKLSESEKELIESVRDANKTVWSEVPYVGVTKRGLYISLTEDDKDDKYLSWKRWHDIVTDGHPHDVKSKIALIEKAVIRMKRTARLNELAFGNTKTEDEQ